MKTHDFSRAGRPAARDVAGAARSWGKPRPRNGKAPASSTRLRLHRACRAMQTFMVAGSPVILGPVDVGLGSEADEPEGQMDHPQERLLELLVPGRHAAELP